MSGFDEYLARNPQPFPEYVDYEGVRSTEQYEELQDKHSYDAVVVWNGGIFVQTVLNDQTLNSKSLRFVHSLTAGVDNYLIAQDFANADHIPLTNSKGCFS